MDDKINVNKTNMNENLEHKKAVLSAFSAERGKIADKGQKYPWVALLGSQESKRKIYLEHAAKRLGLHVLFINWKAWGDAFWENWLEEHGENGILKIDPPHWDSAALDDLPALMKDYRHHLVLLKQMAGTSNLSFFNCPEDIFRLLDKRSCKARLFKAGLPVTEEVFSSTMTRRREYLCFAVSETEERAEPLITGAEKLFAAMRAKAISQIFIKPNYGSGALGVTAFRIQHRTGRMFLYTCAALDTHTRRLVNTRHLQRLEEPKEIVAILNQLLGLDCMFERWYAKAEYQGLTYDLRAVVQDGQVDFLLARLSRGPITNLQLNNHPLPVKDLNLPSSVLTLVHDICQNAIRLYPGIRSAGIDILLEKASLKPRIIEMNGQGDLIYQDIYHKNKIYQHQVQILQGMQREMAQKMLQ